MIFGLNRRALLGVVAMSLLTGGTAAPHSMTVPFFRDDGSEIGQNGPQTGAAGVVTLWNTRDEPITMYLVYSQNDPVGDAQLQQAAPFTVGARRVVQWRPVQDDPAEGDGRDVPNVLEGSKAFGSLVIYWIGGDEMDGALVGRYDELLSGSSMNHVLLEQQPGAR